jgi:hypothetical protein
MNKIKTTSTLVLINGIFMILFGLFHICAILFIFDDSKFKNQMDEAMYKEFFSWFVLAGSFFIFSLFALIPLVKNRKEFRTKP